SPHWFVEYYYAVVITVWLWVRFFHRLLILRQRRPAHADNHSILHGAPGMRHPRRKDNVVPRPGQDDFAFVLRKPDPERATDQHRQGGGGLVGGQQGLLLALVVRAPFDLHLAAVRQA